MNWFLAKMVFRIFCGNGNHVPQFEEQLRLINAEDELHAFYKARLIGDGECIMDSFKNSADVKWKFIDVTELHTLTEFTDGAEIYAVIKEEPDADLYVRSAKKSGTHLLQQSLHNFTGINELLIGT